VFSRFAINPLGIRKNRTGRMSGIEGWFWGEGKDREPIGKEDRGEHPDPRIQPVLVQVLGKEGIGSVRERTSATPEETETWANGQKNREQSSEENEKRGIYLPRAASKSHIFSSFYSSQSLCVFEHAPMKNGEPTKDDDRRERKPKFSIVSRYPKSTTYPPVSHSRSLNHDVDRTDSWQSA